ncbi:phosphodiester glycosidase family protein [Paraliobacillus ryukyuensis]|uniref:phosphodiester glycosidase family protein n=1 Tax=Paraliobacillus ryukyuensis TaxID=200904 RepID=UPI0015C49E45|nr:phosphodiester glycosidase family protein [Paraliobacillus ryukyuensis]
MMGLFIISDTATSFYTLGIKPGNTFAIYNSSYSAQDILNDGCINSFAGFTPLVENGSSVRQSVKDLYSAGSEKHSRQVIAQYSNKDILILTVDGR